MSLTFEKTADTLRLQGAVDIYELPALRRVMLECLAGDADWTIDLGQVTACDATGVQVLWAAHASAVKAGKRLTFETPSASVRECWAELGMPAAFFTADPSN